MPNISQPCPNYCDLLQAKIEISGVVKQCSPWQLTMTTLAMSPFLLEPCNGLWPSSMSNTLLGKLEKYLLAVLRPSVRKVWREFLTKYWDLLLTSGPAKVAILRVEGNNGVVVVLGVGGTWSNIRVYSGQTTPLALEVSWLLNTPPPSHFIKTSGKEKGESLRGRKSTP